VDFSHSLDVLTPHLGDDALPVHHTAMNQLLTCEAHA